MNGSGRQTGRGSSSGHVGTSPLEVTSVDVAAGRAGPRMERQGGLVDIERADSDSAGRQERVRGAAAGTLEPATAVLSAPAAVT
jgi:hypothetical protein